MDPLGTVLATLVLACVLAPSLFVAATHPATEAGGQCCNKNCLRCMDPKAKPFCTRSQENCEKHCGSHWCNAPSPSPAPSPAPKPGPAPGPVPPGIWLTPKQMQHRMGFGINLGNRIDLYDQPPRPVNESFFAAFEAKGFRNVRIPVCWDLHTGKAPPYAIDASFLAQVEQYVDWALAHDLVTILN